MSLEIQSVTYNAAPQTLRHQFALLQHKAAPSICPIPTENHPPQHDPSLNAISFYYSVAGQIVSYAAVVQKSIKHGEMIFDIAGLSYVATDPLYQKLGYGKQTVSAATKWIEQSGIDIGIFTCDPPLAGFYEKAGKWQISPDATLIAGQYEGALRSDTLGKVVLMRLFSSKAIAASYLLSKAVINLDFPPGQFL